MQCCTDITKDKVKVKVASNETRQRFKINVMDSMMIVMERSMKMTIHLLPIDKKEYVKDPYNNVLL